jgi:hypothetical protein
MALLAVDVVADLDAVVRQPCIGKPYSRICDLSLVLEVQLVGEHAPGSKLVSA